jgi:hypothetical protein
VKTDPEVFIQFCLKMGLPAPTPELKFDEPITPGIKPRQWRFDYAWPDAKVFLEVEGGSWIGGRHTSPKGFAEDMAKYNRASCLGWKRLSCTPKQLMTLPVINMIKMTRCA